MRATLPLARRVVAALAERSATLATAESVTGGGVAAALTDVPGASRVFAGGVVAYTVTAKRDVLGLDDELLDEHGPVSGPVAEAMADAARRRFGATLAVATTGVAGPSGVGGGVRIGTVWVAVAHEGRTARVAPHRFEGDRWAVRAQAVEEAFASVLAALEP